MSFQKAGCATWPVRQRWVEDAGTGTTSGKGRREGGGKSSKRWEDADCGYNSNRRRISGGAFTSQKWVRRNSKDLRYSKDTRDAETRGVKKCQYHSEKNQSFPMRVVQHNYNHSHAICIVIFKGAKTKRGGGWYSVYPAAVRWWEHTISHIFWHQKGKGEEEKRAEGSNRDISEYNGVTHSGSAVNHLWPLLYNGARGLETWRTRRKDEKNDKNCKHLGQQLDGRSGIGWDGG